MKKLLLLAAFVTTAITLSAQENLPWKNKNYTILSVGFEAGFNSKTTFNTVFKKFTGLTPTDFREKQKTAITMAEA